MAEKIPGGLKVAICVKGAPPGRELGKNEENARRLSKLLMKRLSSKRHGMWLKRARTGYSF